MSWSLASVLMCALVTMGGTVIVVFAIVKSGRKQ